MPGFRCTQTRRRATPSAQPTSMSHSPLMAPATASAVVCLALVIISIRNHALTPPQHLSETMHSLHHNLDHLSDFDRLPSFSQSRFDWVLNRALLPTNTTDVPLPFASINATSYADDTTLTFRVDTAQLGDSIGLVFISNTLHVTHKFSEAINLIGSFPISGNVTVYDSRSSCRSKFQFDTHLGCTTQVPFTLDIIEFKRGCPQGVIKFIRRASEPVTWTPPIVRSLKSAVDTVLLSTRASGSLFSPGRAHEHC
jgi:hypothetical protein